VSAPLKYEFCWSALPPQAGRHWKLTVEGFEIEMATDRITATIESAMDTEDKLRGRAENIVDNLARATRFQENIDLVVTFKHVTRISSSGSEIALAVGAAMTTAVGKVSVTVLDANGTVAFSSLEAERMAITRLSERARHSVPLQRMLDHIEAYRGDPEKNLGPLYNILQVAETEFGGRDSAAASLGLPATELDELGRIANDRSILNARLPGRGTGPKRPATDLELAQCERVAKTLICSFANRIRV